jgi:ABC-type multidrug transport system fused ATPase/permease subunit
MGFAIWPTFSFNRLFYLLFTYCSMDQCPKSLSGLTPEMWNCVTVLYVSFIIFSLTGMYLFEVVPQEFGVRQPLLFPVYYFMDKFKRRTFSQLNNNVVENAADATIDDECSRIGEIQDFSNYPLICSGLTKQYDTGKLAVNNLNLVVEDKTIFGLLGPNGAGKTTLLSMITGIFSPTSGTAFVGGYSIIDQIDKVHL